jgi:Ca2+/Na+ antiporter
MSNKPGLLPKWIFLHTLMRSLFILVDYRQHFNILSTAQKSKSIFVYLALICGVFRVLAARKVTIRSFYVAIGASFLAEAAFFIYEKYTGAYGTVRVFSEVLLSVFTLAWMVFLYPYYLLDKKDAGKDAKTKEIKRSSKKDTKSE